MATIANLQVLLGMNTAAFAAGAKRAQALAGGLGASLRSKIIGAGAGLFAGFSAVNLIKGSFEAADAMSNLSDRLGIGIESLSALVGAADLADVSVMELTGSLEKMLKTIDDARDLSSAAAKAFQSLGIDPRTFGGQSPDEILFRISDALAAIPDPARRAGAAMEIFGKSGQKSLNLLTQGSAELRRAMAEVRNLGGVLTPREQAKINQADDAMKRLKITARGLGRDLAIVIAPALEQVAIGFRMMLQWIDRSTSSLDENTAAFNRNADAIIDHRSQMAKWIDFVTLKLGILAASWESTSIALRALWRGDLETFRRYSNQFTDEVMKGAEATLLEDRRRRQLDRQRTGKNLIDIDGEPPRIDKIAPREATPALAFGTQEAISAIARFRREDQARDIQKQIEKNTGRGANAAEKAERALEEIRRFMSAAAADVIVQF